MKKIIYLLFTLELIIVSIIGVNILKDNEINNLFFKDVTSITINFSDSSKIGEYDVWIKNLAEKNKVNISKYVFKNENEMIIYTTDKSLNGKVNIDKGRFPKKESKEFISNFETGDKNQSGKFKIFDSDMKITIKSIDDISNSGMGGILYVSTNDLHKINELIKDIPRDVADAKIYDRYNDLNIYISEPLIKDIFLVAICFFVSIIHYSISKSRKLSILRINGYCGKDIIIELCKELLSMMGLSLITAYILYCIFIRKSNMIFELSNYFVIISAICIALNIILFILAIYIYIKKSNYKDLIKGKKPYFIINIMHLSLKVMFVLFLFISIKSCFLNLTDLNKQLVNLSEWEKAKNIYKIEVDNTGEKSLSKEEVDRNKKITQFYNEMTSRKKAFMIDSSNYYKDEDRYLYELNSINQIPEVSSSGKNITVNENYLKLVELNVLSKINHNKNTRNILIPKKLKKYEKEIIKEYLDKFYYEKVDVENFYNKELNLPQSNIKKSDLYINIIYIEDNQSYFSYDSNIEPDNKNKIENPIVIIDNKNIDNSYYYSYMTRCVYFYSDKQDPYGEILPIIKKTGVENSIHSLVSVYNEHGKLIMDLKDKINKEIFTIIILFISNIMIIFNIIASYYEENKYKLYLEKIFGYSWVERNKQLFSTLILIDIIPMVIIGLDGKELILGVGIILVELLIATIFDRKIQANVFGSIIKGEH